MKSLSVNDFCAAHSISRTLFYALLSRGEGPKTFTLGRCRRISEAAANEWIAARESAALVAA